MGTLDAMFKPGAHYEGARLLCIDKAHSQLRD
jgi:hypothetical protein